MVSTAANDKTKAILSATTNKKATISTVNRIETVYPMTNNSNDNITSSCTDGIFAMHMSSAGHHVIQSHKTIHLCYTSYTTNESIITTKQHQEPQATLHSGVTAVSDVVAVAVVVLVLLALD